MNKEEQLRKEVIVYLRNQTDIKELKTKIEELRMELKKLDSEQREGAKRIADAIDAKGGGMTVYGKPVSFYAFGQAYLMEVKRGEGNKPKQLIIQEIEELV